MINLQLLFPKSQPAAAVASAIASAATTLNVQPAPGNAAPTAPSDPFPRTSQPGADLEAVRAGIRNVVETTTVDLSVAHSLAAGTAVVLPIQGTAFMIDKGTDVGTAKLHIQDQTLTPVNSINVFPGDTYDLPFTFIVVENTAQAAGTVLRIHYGTGISFKPSLAGTLTISGNVAITQTAAGSPQGPDQASFNAKRFYGSIDAAGAAAQFTYIGLNNPAASGVTVYVDAIKVYQFAANLPVMLVFGNAQAGASGFNNNIGGAASLAKLNTLTNATDAGAGYGSVQSVGEVLTASEVSVAVCQPGPIVLPAGKGIAIRPQQANNQISVLYVWREI